MFAWHLCCSIVLATTVASLAASPAGDDKPEAPVDLLWGAKIPMRDGVTLNATVYKPADTKQPLPVILTMTPYIADSYHDWAMYFSRHGYVFALVDVRGRGNSGGEFKPWANDGRDGYDAVEWLARQSWCNGKVAMWGGSYAGFNQWATLKGNPPHLMTIVPAAAVHPGVDWPCPPMGGIPSTYAIQWLTDISGVTANDKLHDDTSFWNSTFAELYERHLAFCTLDALVGNPSPIFQEELRHPIADAYWDTFVPSSEQYRQMRIPVLTITGHYDDDQPGALAYYQRHLKYAAPEARDNHYLVVGPWDHAGTRTPKREVGGLTFGEASLVDLNKLHLEWYDWILKGGEKPAFLKDRVAYYVTGQGAEQWKYAGSLNKIPTTKRRFFLRAPDLDSRIWLAGDVFQSGRLREKPPQSDEPPNATATYTYDPLDTRDTLPEFVTQNYRPNAYVDQAGVLQLAGRGVIYHTDPFPEAVEIAGSPSLRVCIKIDVPDTDFWVSLYEILPAGGSVWLASDALRARYREFYSKRDGKPLLVSPGSLQWYQFDHFPFFARRISKGSRLRLVITSPNSMYLQKNYNSGGVVAEENGGDARVAHIEVLHHWEHAGYLDIPIVGDKREPTK
ncbi:MAG TPA: CocE/NonD family hydrolase [Phycisphaerae bacterium]|nr:CocE/NonD family hydrolase [Phycisphaerae bacterium]